MKPEQLEIAQLKREVARLKAERDILKKPRPTSRRSRREVRLHREAPGDLAGGMVVRGARCLAGRLLCLADEAAECAKAERRRAVGEGAGKLSCERPDLRRSACLARCACRWSVMRTASDRAAD